MGKETTKSERESKALQEMRSLKDELFNEVNALRKELDEPLLDKEAMVNFCEDSTWNYGTGTRLYGVQFQKLELAIATLYVDRKRLLAKKS